MIGILVQVDQKNKRSRYSAKAEIKYSGDCLLLLFEREIYSRKIEPARITIFRSGE